MRSSGTWFNGGLSSAGLMVELDHLRSIFHPKQFDDSVIISTEKLSNFVSDD